jgi:CheY-like chemotaxis protein
MCTDSAHGRSGSPVGAVLDVSQSMKAVTCAVIESPPGGESRRLPLASENSRVDRQKPPLHVLVVDDEPLIRWSVTQALTDLGVEVEQAADATSTLAAIATAQLPFDVVVLDLRLPDVDDLSLVATVRRAQPRAAVILMTAFGTPDVVANAYQLGVRAILNKPFELDDMSRTVLTFGLASWPSQEPRGSATVTTVPPSDGDSTPTVPR